MLIADIISFILRKLFCKGKSSLTDKTEMKIRTLLSLFGALVLIYAGSDGISKLEIEQIAIPVKGLNPRLNGTTIVQLSDIHLGPFNGQKALSNLLAKANELNADVVVITGDLVDASVVALREIVKPLANIRSKHGVYFSTGKNCGARPSRVCVLWSTEDFRLLVREPFQILAHGVHLQCLHGVGVLPVNEHTIALTNAQ